MTLTTRRAFLAQSMLGTGALLFPSSLRAAENSSIPVCKISGSKRHSIGGKNYTYYKVETPTDIPFYVVTEDKCNLSNPFCASTELKTMGRSFPGKVDPFNPVALIEGKELGLSGNLKIYNVQDGHGIKYDFSPLIDIPSHTSVSPEYLFAIENILSKRPKALLDELEKSGVKIILAKDYEDAYYYYFPHFKEEDKKKSPIKDKEWVGYKDGTWIDNRKFSHAPSRTNGLTVYSPQKYEEPLESILEDRTKNIRSVENTLLHELGHVISNIKNYINNSDFDLAFKADKRRLKVLRNNDTAYAYTAKEEAFAEVACCLLGGYSDKRKKDTLCSLYECTEYIRTKVLPDFGIKISQEDIEKIIGNEYIAYN